MQELKNNLLSEIHEELKFFSQIGVDFIFADSKQAAVFLSPEHSPFQIVQEKILGCQRCELAKSRTHAVPGEGNPQAQLMFVGEAPGMEEDLEGRPFVGKAGHLLTRIIKAMNYRREHVFITNIVKCRPPSNRNPNSEEIEKCHGFLLEQLNLIKPKAIVALGNVPAQFFLKSKTGITSLRGKFYEFNRIQVMPTFHPSYLVRNENDRELKRLVWEDMKKVMALLDKR